MRLSATITWLVVTPLLASTTAAEPSHSSWKKIPDMAAPRGETGTVVIDKKLYVFGGLKKDRNTDSADHWVLDLNSAGSSAKWKSVAAMPAERPGDSIRSRESGLSARASAGDALFQERLKPFRIQNFFGDEWSYEYRIEKTLSVVCAGCGPLDARGA